MATRSKEIESYNYFKAFACCFIVLIHCKFPGYIGNILRTVAKFGVPYFYMVSGFFFLYGSNCEYNYKKNKEKILHIVRIMMGAALFYFAFSAIYILILKQRIEFENIVTGKTLFKLIISNSPFVYSHLWFLGALLYCYIFAGVLKERICGRWKKNIIVLLLVMFSVMSEILPRFGLKISFYGVALYNVFIFRALPFFLLGIYLRENMEAIVFRALEISKRKLQCVILFGFLLSLLERIIFVESQFYVGTYIAVIALFVFCMTYPNGYNKTIQYIGKKLSMYIYILHIAVMKICDLHGGGVLWSAVKPILVIAISTLISKFIVDILHIKKIKLK